MSEKRRSFLRAAVNERLAIAAEEIFVLLESTIAEYEEEVCRSREENQRNRELLDSLLRLQVLGVQTGSRSDTEPRVKHETPETPQEPSKQTSPNIIISNAISHCDGSKKTVRLDKSNKSSLSGTGPRDKGVQTSFTELGVKQETRETPRVKKEPQEQSVEQEEKQLPEFTAACVSSLLQLQDCEESQGQLCGGAAADISSQTHLHSETEEQRDTDSYQDWEHPGSSSAAQIQSNADGDHYNQVQGRLPGTVHVGAKRKCVCSVCEKRFTTNQILKLLHTGERPYNCSTCMKIFNRKVNSEKHVRVHAPYSYAVCEQTFSNKGSLSRHTDEKTYSCPFCMKTFKQQVHLDKHVRVHTGERPYSCSVCEKAFAQSSTLKNHMKTHRVGFPYSC